MTTTQTVRSDLTLKARASLRRVLAQFAPLSIASRADRDIAEHAEIARRDSHSAHVENLVDAWAELQTEGLMREIMRSPMGWISRRPTELDEFVLTDREWAEQNIGGVR